MLDESNVKVGVLLANTGSPDEPTPEAVKKYLKQFLSCPRIVPVNKFIWWFILRLFVLPKRSKASAEKYKKIWTPEGSPLILYTQELTDALNAYYAQSNTPISVKFAMSFGKPSIGSVLDEFREEHINKLIVLSMYPQSAYSTEKIVEDEVRAHLKKVGWRPYVKYINGYSDHQYYPKAIATCIREAGFQPNSTDKLILGFHSVPLADIEAGDTYELQVGSSCLAIASELDISRNQWAIAYQSRFDKNREWLSPFTAEVLGREAQSDEHRVFFVCPNFAIDNLETLYDVMCSHKPNYLAQLARNGKEIKDDSFIYVPCLNARDEHIRLITEIVRSNAL